MKLQVKKIRQVIRRVLRENYPFIRDAVSPAKSDREAIGSLADDNSDNDIEVTNHLQDPNEEPEDVRGPLPPVDDVVYATSDPYTNMWSVLPTHK